MCHLIELLPSFRLKEEFDLDNAPPMSNVNAPPIFINATINQNNSYVLVVVVVVTVFVMAMWGMVRESNYEMSKNYLE